MEVRNNLQPTGTQGATGASPPPAPGPAAGPTPPKEEDTIGGGEGGTTQPPPPPPPGNPGAPPPKYVELPETEKAALIRENPWMANPSFMAAVTIAIFTIMRNSSENKMVESTLKRELDAKIFELGKENAEAAKVLKELAANKEFIRAASSLISAGVAGLNYAANVAAPAAAQRRVDNEFNGPNGKITLQEKKIQSMELEARGVIVNDSNLADFDNQMQKPITDKTKLDDIAREKNTLATLQTQKTDTYSRYLQQEQSLVQNRGEMMKSGIDSTTSILTGLITLKEGDEERNKAIRDALLQSLNKTTESLNKSDPNQYNKTADELNQTRSSISSGTRLSSRG